MKQYLIAIAMVLMLNSNVSVTAQKHRHTPRTEQVSDTVKHNEQAIEAYSDTTTATNQNVVTPDDYDSNASRRHVTYSSDDSDEVVSDVLDGMAGETFMALLVPILGILCFGLLLPIIIVIVVFYFINRNRREKYRLAEMAIKNGQPIPEELLKNDDKDDWYGDDYKAGVRQMFTGVGIAIFLGIVAGEIGVGIGALVFFIGLGKWFIARQDKNRRDDINHMNDLNRDNKE